MSEWSVSRLDEIADVRPSNVDKLTVPGELPVRLCNYLDVYNHDYITPDIAFMEATATEAEIARFRVERGDVLLTKDSETPDDIGISAVVTHTIPGVVCGYHLALIKPNRAKVDPVYLAKQIAAPSISARFGRLANGSTRYALSLEAVASTPIPMGPIQVQRHIAEILSTLDEAITQTEALIAKTQQIKAGLMHDLFTRGVTADGKLRPLREEAPQLYKQSPIGWVPANWEITEFGNCLTSRPQNGVYKPPEFYGEAGTRIVRIDSFNWGESPSVDSLKRVNLTPGERRIYSLSVDDILVNRVNSIDYVGKSTIISEVPEPIVFESNMMRCRVAKDRLLPEFALKWLCSATAMAHFHSHAKSAIAQASVNQKDVTKLTVVVPALEEQRSILDRLASAISAATEGRAHFSKLRSLKSALMADLLTGRVRVPKAAPAGP